MRYSMGFAGALLLAMSTSLFATDAIRDAGTKVRGEWLGAVQPMAGVNQGLVYRTYNVAPGAPAPMMAAVPAAPSSNAVRSYSFQPAQSGAQSAARTTPYLRAEHKVLGQYGD